jgi:glycine oxidase
MATSERTADVAIVGGGVIGCTIARRAARDGLSAVVVERGTPGMEALWAAAGMLSPWRRTDRGRSWTC